MQKATCTTRDVLQVQEDAKDCKDEEVFSQMPGQLQHPKCNTAATSTASCSSTLHEQTWNLLQSDAADVKEKDYGSLQQLFKRGSSLSLTSDGADVSETDDSGRCESLAPEVMPPLPCPHSGSFDGDIGVTNDSSATIYLAAPDVPPAASVQWISTWAALKMTMCFLLIAVVGAAPRGIALAIIDRAVPQAPMPEALDNFKAMWAPCKEDRDNPFTGYSPDGQMYRWLLLSDHILWYAGVTVAYIGMLLLMFPVEPSVRCSFRGGDSFALLRCSLCVLGVVNFALWTVIDATLYHDAMTQDQRLESHSVFGFWLLVVLTLFLFSYFVLSNADCAWLRGRDRILHGEWRRRKTFSILLGLAMTAIFLFCGTKFQFSKYWSWTGGDWTLLICFIGLSRFLLWIMRFIIVSFLDLTDNTTFHAMNIFVFMTTTTISLAVRTNTGVDLASAFGLLSVDKGRSFSWTHQVVETFLNSVMILIAQMMSCVMSHLVLVQKGSILFRGMSKKSLDGILTVHVHMEKLKTLIHGQLCCEELAEFCVIFIIAAQELAMPVWNQWGGGQILTFSDFQHDHRRIVMMQFAVRLLVQFVSYFSELYLSQRVIPWTFQSLLRQYVATPALLFYIGFSISAPVIGYDANLCLSPLSALLYNECLRRPLYLDNQHVCRGDNVLSMGGRTNHFVCRRCLTPRLSAITELLQQTGVTPLDLGCSDGNVSELVHDHCGFPTH